MTVRPSVRHRENDRIGAVRRPAAIFNAAWGCRRHEQSTSTNQKKSSTRTKPYSEASEVKRRCFSDSYTRRVKKHWSLRKFFADGWEYIGCQFYSLASSKIRTKIGKFNSLRLKVAKCYTISNMRAQQFPQLRRLKRKSQRQLSITAPNVKQ